MFQHSLFQLSESDNILIKNGSAHPPASALAKNLTLGINPECIQPRFTAGGGGLLDGSLRQSRAV